jgi:hypothetical protein
LQPSTGPSRRQPKAKAAPGRKPTPGLDPSARRQRPARSGSRRRSSTPAVDRAIAQTGIPATVSSSGNFVLGLFGATLGLSLLFLVFSSAEKPGSGAHAVPSIVNGLVSWLGRFVSLGDFWQGPVSHQPGVAAPGPAGPGTAHPGAYSKRVERNEVAGPPTPPRIRRRQRQEAQKPYAHTGG